MRLPIGSEPQSKGGTTHSSAVPDVEVDETMSLVDGILQEISVALKRFADSGEPTIIGLRGLPIAEGQRNLLEERLGRGEVAVAIDAAGVSNVWETSYAGVWWVSHYGGAGIAAEEIVIAHVPEILLSNIEDARAAAARLQSELSGELEKGVESDADAEEVLNGR